MENLDTDIKFNSYVIPEGTVPKRRNGVSIKAGLEKYSGTWDKKTASHLLRRATFGPKMKDIIEFTKLNLDTAVDKLLEFNEPLELPLNYADKDDPYVKLGESWFGMPDGQNTFGPRINSFLARWFANILNSGNSVGEKMTLFWHNHFVTQMLTVRDEDNSFVYYRTLRENALANFKILAEKMTIDSAMLRYLNGNENIVGRPNENYARELMELFTIGKGPLIGPGNYTNYTEEDVVAAAKVLTGWRALRDTNESKFYPQLHDKSTKQFSSAYSNHTISNNNENEYKDLIEMIFAQQETARFICRKIYRWFVYYEIDQQTEDNVITPMADLLRANNYEVKPVLKALFTSAHFYDYWNVGCVIKSPLDYVVGLYRHLEMKFPTDYKGQYNSWLDLGANFVAVQEMLLGEPPSVAGWPAMYQEPSYHRLWMTSVSAPYRAVLADYVAGTPEIKGRNYTISFDVFELAKQTTNPVDPNVLIKDLAEFLLPVEITDYQLEYLKSNLLPNGLQDSQWSAVWAGYVAQPENTTNTTIVNNLLRNLLRACLNIAEYHLI
ncbi:DUF1800 domain-containing protein [bacterium]|nr:MAG: DUF1800 domain-containing protein [bacterium]